MRTIYVDEAGTSAPEPVSVVVALVTRPDEELILLDEIKSLKDQFVPGSLRDGFVAHGKDIVSGKKYRDLWDAPSRFELLRSMMRLPNKHNITLCIGAVKRGSAIQRGAIDGVKHPYEIDHLYAFILAMTWADKFLRQYCSEEMAQAVAEDHDLRTILRKHINIAKKVPLQLLTTKRRMNEPDSIQVIESNRVERLIDEVDFVGKKGSPILQIADACAYGIRRFFAKERHGESYLEEILGKEFCEGTNIKTDTPWDHYETMRVFDTSAYPLTIKPLCFSYPTLHFS